MVNKMLEMFLARPSKTELRNNTCELQATLQIECISVTGIPRDSYHVLTTHNPNIKLNTLHKSRTRCGRHVIQGSPNSIISERIPRLAEKT